MKNLTLLLLGLFLATTACKKGGGTGDGTDSTATDSAATANAGPTRAANRDCPAGTNLTVEGKGLASTAFEIKKVIVQSRTDSTITFYLLNYDAPSFDKGALTAGQVGIEVKLIRRGGSPLESGSYDYGGGNSDTHYTMVTVYNKGANPIASWSSGQPSPANVDLMAVDGNKLCGRFTVNQEAFSDYTGYKLNGDFVIELP